MKVKLGPLQAGPQMTNPAAAAAEAGISAVLQKQRQAANAEAAQMKLRILPQAKPTATITGRNVSNSSPLQKSGPGTIGPEKTMDSTGKPAAQTVPQFSGTALVCGNDPTMRILTVTGESFPATFTSDDRYNFYTIVGCSFGNLGPTSKVYIYYQNSFLQTFRIEEWNENGIKLSLQPNLAGLLDQDNLTLVVQRADGKQATKGGYKFYAARETKRLETFPRDQFSLWQFTLNDTSHLTPEYASPSSLGTPSGGQPGIRNYAAEVYWDCTNCSAVKGRFNNVYMQGNEDVWHLKNLKPGFVLQGYGMAYRDLDCSGFAGINKEGVFAVKLQGNDLHAQWQGQTCVNNGCGGAMQPDCFAASGSNYLISITVTGPRGVDPWTGKPAH